MVCVWLAIFLIAFVILAAKRASLSVWGISYFVLLVVFSVVFQPPFTTGVVLWCVFIVLSALLQVRPIRCALFSKPIMRVFRKVMPSMSDTERAALLAGNVSWEGQLFSGRPDWQVLADKPMSKLSADEQAFMDGPVEELCAMISDWDVTHKEVGVPQNILDFLARHGFFGMIIPKEYGGLQFSAYGHAQVIVKVGTASTAVSTVISVPNSLGPAELLLHYGTDEQKNYYLPRLAKGQEIPCFALTSPHAGSDAAGSMQDYGEVCRAEFEGKEQLCIRLNWSKRYITLCPIATLLGLAFKLYDPDKLLGDENDLGITCALIPVTTPGVETGRRHYPLTSAFPNGPTQGEDVIIPLDWVIGGQEQVGNGWTMLMQCLAAGRAISLPSMATGGVKKAVFTSGVYAQVREQFNVPIGTFDGIQAALATVGGHAFMMDALRTFVLSDLDEGYQASVASAIAKAYVTEWGREAIVAAMDIHGGKAICMGPSNYLAQSYIESPISITVEGANILTRSLIIFGQGLIRCHPYLYDEMESCRGNDRAALRAFDKAFFAHGGYIISNVVRSFFFGLTGGRGISTTGGKHKRYMQKISRYCAALGLLSDVSMAVLGGKLKRMERLSERMGAVVGHLYAASAVLHFAKNHPELDCDAFVGWSMKTLIAETKKNIVAFLHNFPNRAMGRCLRFWIFPLGLHLKKPSDREEAKLAMALQSDTPVRTQLIDILYRTASPKNPIGEFDETLRQLHALAPLEKQLKQAVKDQTITGHTYAQRVADAVEKQLITPEQAEELNALDKRRMAIINVDDFSDSELKKRE
jgi:acyl-CoA dehydrogenase